MYSNYVGNTPRREGIYLKDIQTARGSVNIKKMTNNNRLCHLCAYSSRNRRRKL